MVEVNGLGREMHDLCRELFPICRSITGNGFRESLDILKSHVPSLQSIEVSSGTQCFDWTVPREWNIRDAYIVTPDGRRICEFGKNNLHVVGYSVPVNTTVSLNELQKHLYSIQDQPDAVPYVTSYYKERWGFCIPHRLRETLLPGEYHVRIDSKLTDGHLTYGEFVLPGKSQNEVLISTYLCHPSMANNELSGPVVTCFLAKWLAGKKQRKFTYRIIIVPETIGSIVYLSRNLETMKNKTVAGFNVTCVGDDRAYSYLPSRQERSLADRAAIHVLDHLAPSYKTYSFLERGSDERQYCSPGVNLPVCSIMRSKYGTYPEYHTSLDNLDLVTPSGLFGGYEAHRKAIECLESDELLRTTLPCEPQLGKRGLYPTLSTPNSGLDVRSMMNLLAYCDGRLSTLEIATKIGTPLWEMTSTINKLKEAGLIEPVHDEPSL